MPHAATVLRVFIASPSDVQEERDRIADVLHRWNDVHSAELSCILQPVRWETHAAPELGDRPQAILNRQILDESDMVLAIFWTKLGSPTGEAESGTVEEIERAVDQKKPVLLYFSSAPVNPDMLDPAELIRLRAFRERMKTRGLYHSYESVDALCRNVEAHIHGHVRGLLETAQQTQLGQWFGNRFVLHERRHLLTAVVTDKDNGKVIPFKVAGLPKESSVDLIVEVEKGFDDRNVKVQFVHRKDHPIRWDQYERRNMLAFMPDDETLYVTTLKPSPSNASTIKVFLLSWYVKS